MVAYDFQIFNGNILVNSLNKSYNISNLPPYSPLPTLTSTFPPLYSPLPTLTSTLPPLYSPLPTLTSIPPPTAQVSSSNSLNYVNEKRNEKGDLAVVLFSYNRITSDELDINKNEYLIVTNWNVGDEYVYGYKRNNPQQKGKFPSSLVRKISENTGFFFKLFKITICDI